MPMRYVWVLLSLGFLPACQSASLSPLASGTGSVPSRDGRSKLVAYVAAERISESQLYEAIPPADRAAALADLVLERGITTRLRNNNLSLTSATLDAERQRLLDALSDNPDEAARLLDDLRERRGLDASGFEGLLRRSAGLRALVASDVTVSDEAIQRAYDLRFGDRVQARLITTDTLAQASDVMEQLAEGVSFASLAGEFSTDPSAARGGLLEPLSPLDPALPEAIRAGLRGLPGRPAGLSDILALETGYAILRFERTVETELQPLASVREQLAAEVRGRAENLRMRELARVILTSTDVITLDPRLTDAWQRQREQLTSLQLP